MKLNSATLDALRVGFKTEFQAGLGQADPQYERIATRAPSSNRSESYGWLGKVPSVRKWVGDRMIQNIAEHDYTIKNQPFELTIGVDRDDIEDDNLGMYGPLFQEMGMATAAHTDQQVFDLLKSGFTTPCFDGQNFFDTDHPVLDADGNEQSVSNMAAGSSTPWYLLSTSRPLKPIIFQTRKDWEFVAMDAPTDSNVFRKKEFEYGIDSRSAVGFGFWQTAFGSKATLDAGGYEAARAAMMSFKSDYDRSLGIVPNLLVVPPTLEGAANEIVKSALTSGGGTNKWAGTAEVLVAPWLA